MDEETRTEAPEAGVEEAPAAVPPAEEEAQAVADDLDDLGRLAPDFRLWGN